MKTTKVVSRKKLSPAWLTALAPAVLILLATITFSALIGGPHTLRGWQSLWKTLLRFFRFTFVLSFPLCVLIPTYGLIVEKKKRVLLHIPEKQDLAIHFLKHCIFRPFQGIGVGLLFSTKLLAVLQLIAGPAVKPSLLIPEGQFELARLIMITAITVLVSLLLSTLWTLDDMGVRYFNRKDHELKMMGKYAGTLVPVIFGTYGLLGLLASYPTGQAFVYALKIVAILYPPLAVFTVAHACFVQKREGVLFKKTPLKKGCILEHV